MEFMKLLSGDAEIIRYSEAPEDYVFVSEQLSSEGFHIQREGYRFRHVFDYGSAGCRLWVEAPCDGAYYLALQVHDTFGSYEEELIPVPDEECGPYIERLVELSVGDRTIGTFRFGGDDKKYYLFVTHDPVELKKGEEISYRLLDGERAIFTSILLLKDKPREQMNGIMNITTDNGEVRFWTKLASRVQLIFGEFCLVENQYLNNHRFRVPKEYFGIRFVIEATDEQGRIVRGRGTCRTKVAEQKDDEDIKAKIRNGGDFEGEKARGTVPVHSVLPVKQGVLYDGRGIYFADDQGNRYSADGKVTCRWPDQSIKTIALCSVLPLDGRAYEIQNSADEGLGTVEESGLQVSEGETGITVVNGEKTYFFEDDSLYILPDRQMAAVLYDENGERYEARGGKYTVTAEGLNHVKISRVNHFRQGEKEHLKCLTHVHFYKGIDAYKLEFGFENDLMEKEFAVLTGIYLEEQGNFGEPFEILQVDENTILENEAERKLRHNGEFVIGNKVVVIEDFWQNYPKFVGLSDEKLSIGICPFITHPERFRDDDIEMESRLFFYTKTGKYEFHCGCQRYHSILFGEEAGKLKDIPFLLPEKEIFEESAAFGHVAFGCPNFPDYDDIMSRGMDLYLEHQESYREFGMLNYGDSFGERRIHWTNHEYDFTNALLLHYLRTGDLRFYKLAKAAAAHYAEVDNSHRNIHFEEDGYPFIHTVGHANNYYPHSLLPRSFEKIKSHIGHLYTQGMADYYKITGDEKYKDVAVQCGTSIAKYYAVKYDFQTEREPGWGMLALEAAYELTLDPYYLNACSIIIERVYDKQDPKRGCCRKYQSLKEVPGATESGYIYGGKAFMHGLLGTAMKYYYQHTGDEKAKKSIIEMSRWLVDEMFDEVSEIFWYTDTFRIAERRAKIAETNIEILDMILFSCMETGKVEYLDVARRAFRKALESPYYNDFDVAKIFTMRLRFAPEIMYYYDKALKQFGLERM